MTTAVRRTVELMAEWYMHGGEFKCDWADPKDVARFVAENPSRAWCCLLWMADNAHRVQTANDDPEFDGWLEDYSQENCARRFLHVRFVLEGKTLAVDNFVFENEQGSRFNLALNGNFLRLDNRQFPISESMMRRAGEFWEQQQLEKAGGMDVVQ